ncbi:MAG: hypothetical protein UY76_C0028G0019 [Candidatus Uhrbacteria bacterium GW2011_GWA2_52_8d]|uniref:DUF4352 domain-containing protein n=1 Tax=Candidatus Uhrbacteria bacterium GW2011_GWA2_52_8d TaxID=1618979 RepID=A0A0G1XMD6_9BACT|nr:MAG: hypothetical protein UY76_C0028G0019 [Candidatus Uhrbacteria bacterium GW2011_GWA2_52_8d]
MFENSIFAFLIIAAGAGATFAFETQGEPQTQIVSAQTKASTEPELVGGFSQEQDGIEVTIEKIDQQDDHTTLLLGLSNHQYDLDQDSIFTRATLDGRPSQSFTLLSNAAGGHHVEAEVVFEKTTEGIFVITPAEGITFTFEALW